MIHYVGWHKPSTVHPFKYWLFHIWNEYEPYHRGVEWDGLRILGFEFEHLEKETKE